jgi:hypothetical protein
MTFIIREGNQQVQSATLVSYVGAAFHLPQNLPLAPDLLTLERIKSAIGKESDFDQELHDDVAYNGD